MQYVLFFIIASVGVILWWNASMRRRFKELMKGSTCIFLEQMHIHEDGYSPNKGIWIGLQDLRKSIPYWSDCCIDTTHQALSALWVQKDNAFEQLTSFVKQYGDKVISFVWKHYDDEEGSFRNHVSAWPSLFATFSAIGIIKDLIIVQRASSVSDFDEMRKRPLSKEELVSVLGKDRVRKISQFLRHCRSALGGFSDTPYESPTVVSSDAAIIVSWDMEEVYEDKDREDTKDFIWKCVKEIPDGKLAFKNSPGGGEYCSSFTRYAIRVLDRLKGIEKNSPDLDKVQKVVLFLKDCEDPSSGGYSWRPGKPPSIVHTNLVFNAFRKIVFEKGIVSEDGIIKPQKLASFIKMRIDQGLGYEKDSPPNMHVTANTALLASRLADKYRDQVKIDEKVRSTLRNAILSFFDENEGGFRGYNPIKI